MERIFLKNTDEYPDAIKHAVEVLRAGGVIVYPTDTVYGLGADATNPVAVERVRALKGRDADKPILAMVSDMAMLEKHAVVTPLARRLVECFLPGPLTMVLNTRSGALRPVAMPDGSVGFRMPDQRLCAELVAKYGRPITSTSVNRSGLLQPQDLDDMLAQITHEGASVDLVLDAGTLPQRAPSTIVDARGVYPVFLRIGAIEEVDIVARVSQ